jgi:hypothetical protein
MATYAGPSSYSDKTRRLSGKAQKLRDEVDSGAEAQKVNRVFGQSDRQKEEIKAIDHVLNMKESMAEDLEQQVADEYPKGTQVYGKKSRNKAGYGEPKKYADGGMVGDRRSYGKKR